MTENLKWTDRIAQHADREVLLSEAAPLRLVWEYIGEGTAGDFDPADPTDAPLLRFSVLTREDDGTWEQIEDGSYCTTNPVGTDPDALDRLGRYIISVALGAGLTGSPKRLLEECSWLDARTHPGLTAEEVRPLAP